MIKEKIQQHEDFEESIKDYFYPKLEVLLLDGKINNGLYPKPLKFDSTVRIEEFGTKQNGELYVQISIHWCGDVYDTDSVSMQESEWDLIIKKGN